MRIVVPASCVAAVWAALVHGAHTNSAVGIVGAVVATVCALLPTTGDAFADGASYGDERRFLLRPPGAYLLGPIEVAWAIVVAGTAGGPLLLLTHQWVAGAIVTVVGPLAAWRAWQSLHALSYRWLVFVPAGVVLHDALALAEPTLFARTDVVALAPAPADTKALDLTANALGLALQIDLTAPHIVGVVAPRSARQRSAEQQSISRLMFTPTRPGAVATEAHARKIGAPARSLGD